MRRYVLLKKKKLIFHSRYNGAIKIDFPVYR